MKNHPCSALNFIGYADHFYFFRFLFIGGEISSILMRREIEWKSKISIYGLAGPKRKSIRAFLKNETWIHWIKIVLIFIFCLWNLISLLSIGKTFSSFNLLSHRMKIHPIKNILLAQLCVNVKLHKWKTEKKKSLVEAKSFTIQKPIIFLSISFYSLESLLRD